jgi:hypothetical protein
MGEYTNNPPFPMGQTWFGHGGSPDADDAKSLEGKEWEFQDTDLNRYGQTNQTFGTGKYSRCRLVRNRSGGSLSAPAGRLAYMDPSTSYVWGTGVTGYAAVTAQKCYPIDWKIPSGVSIADDDLFYIIVKGLAVVKTALSGAAGVLVINPSDVLVSVTAATSGATTSGRVVLQDLTGATAVLGVQITNAIGRALSAATTGNTNSDLLMEVGAY